MLQTEVAQSDLVLWLVTWDCGMQDWWSLRGIASIEAKIGVWENVAICEISQKQVTLTFFCGRWLEWWNICITINLINFLNNSSVPKIEPDISWELSPLENIHMKCQILFSEKYLWMKIVNSHYLKLQGNRSFGLKYQLLCNKQNKYCLLFSLT